MGPRNKRTHLIITKHSGEHGFKISNFFPVENGFMCPTAAVPAPATFHNITSYKNRHFGIWGEFLIDVSFDTLTLHGAFN